eukprot:CAMPEP_0202706082 /NCGR_PEP_ID=MMETSP1385-20130828/18558_1 /ASSEMBLY_ACC=CAM_ASM_000861 /TAXON_ID=933848 /ORGANISM="Elphidium margaritaceum" /LENGTH=394 /DNA_ID=CAMNT_0049364469 /DNA_START=108 /DNA_END=1292 /DNA_ORIENTATION=-
MNKRKLPVSSVCAGEQIECDRAFKKQRLAIADDKQTDCTSANANIKTIGTHSGTFHCDEVLACYMLSQHTKDYRNAKIVRSRDSDVLSTADIVVDVGSEFDLKGNKFDHHQREFNQQFSEEYATKLSSAGLIYKYFGKEIVRDIIENRCDDVHTNNDEEMKNAPLTEDMLEVVYNKVYASLIESVDAIDNGIKQYDTETQARYLQRTDLGSRVSGLNAWWNQASDDDIQMRQFGKAMRVTGEALVDCVLWIYKSWLPARNIVDAALRQRHEVHSSGQILRLSTYCPWVEHFYQMHEANALEPMPVYVLFADTSGQWRIRAVPDGVASFGLIKALPNPWRGKRDTELSELCGVDGCVFVHSSGFIGGNKTYDGALKMAELALQYQNDGNTADKTK